MPSKPAPPGATNPARIPHRGPQSRERREALKTLGKAIGALAVGPAALSAAGCSRPLIDSDAIAQMPLADVPQGRKMILLAERRVELLREGNAVTARLMVCTHEFCDLTWYEVEDNYRCTCHNGKFFPDGRPKSGPVNKVMFSLPTRIEGDTLFVGPAGDLALSG